MSQSSSPTHVISGAELERRLGEPDLRILDATVLLDPNSWHANSGRSQWAQEHIPGSAFVDLIEEFSDPSADEGLPEGVHAYRLPTAEAFTAAITRYGVSDNTHVVVYDTSAGMWASRLWWLLRVFGHGRVSVLDGGWGVWKEQQRPTSSDPAPTFTRGTFVAKLQPELLATTDEVVAALGKSDTVLVNALWPELFRGEATTPLPRQGRIPGSVNVPFTETVGPNGALLAQDDLRELFASQGVTGDKRVVTYCGGGIAATFDALALAQLGIDAAVYDGSLVEWVADPDLPMESG